MNEAETIKWSYVFLLFLLYLVLFNHSLEKDVKGNQWRRTTEGWSVKGNAGEKHKWARTVKCLEGKLHGRAVEGEKDGESSRTSISDCQTVCYVKEERKFCVN